MKRGQNYKLCIVGSAPSKADALYSDPSYDVWAISGAVYSESLDGTRRPDTDDNSWNSVTRVDAFFEMHKRRTFAEKLSRLATCGKPVIMQRREPDIPTSEAYPADEISAAIGEDYSSTIAYMMAYALQLGYREIRLYGVIMLHKTEYVRQRPGLKYYLGIAKAREIPVWAPENTQLTTSLWRYGYDDHDALCGQILAKKDTIEDDIRNQTKAIEAAQATLWQLKGASITCDNLVAEIKGGLA
jgi:hypothetical protein